MIETYLRSLSSFFSLFLFIYLLWTRTWTLGYYVYSDVLTFNFVYSISTFTLFFLFSLNFFFKFGIFVRFLLYTTYVRNITVFNNYWEKTRRSSWICRYWISFIEGKNRKKSVSSLFFLIFIYPKKIRTRLFFILYFLFLFLFLFYYFFF